MDEVSEYAHTQVGRIHWVMFAIASLLAWWSCSYERSSRPLLAAALLLVFAGFSFRTLTVRDRGDRLNIAFGPLRWLSKSIPYAKMRGAEVARSSVMDGWGIHWLPGRGWIYNLWGRDCVCIDLGGRSVRIGTDDPEGLADFLRRRIAG